MPVQARGNAWRPNPNLEAVRTLTLRQLVRKLDRERRDPEDPHEWVDEPRRPRQDWFPSPGGGGDHRQGGNYSQGIGNYSRENADPGGEVLQSQSRRGGKSDFAYYDYIVVGGGGGGCPFARTMAESGFKVLVVERGDVRLKHRLTHDIYGSGLVMADTRVSQLVMTQSGVRTHVASVLGGGTATGMAIAVEEDPEYLSLLESTSGEPIDHDLFYNASEWIALRLAQPMRQLEPYSEHWRRAFNQQGYKTAGTRLRLLKETSWNAFSLFDSQDHGFRRSADVLLGSLDRPQPPTLDIVTNTIAERIQLEPIRGSQGGESQGGESQGGESQGGESQGGESQGRESQGGESHGGESQNRESPEPRFKATCVLVRATRSEDLEPIGGREPLSGPPERFRRRMSHALSRHALKTVCAKSEIVLSAGAVFSPVLLARSGVGAAEQMELLGINAPAVLNENVGSHLIDRGLLPVAYYQVGDTAIGRELEPQVCGRVGLATHGFGRAVLGARTLDYSQIGVEEMAGGRIVEGFIYATRIFVSPTIRSHPIVDVLMTLLNYCSETAKSNPVCAAFSSAPACLRKLTASWYFVNEPKSRGYVKTDYSGQIRVDPNYYSNPQDVVDGLRGIQNLIRIARSDALKGAVETLDEKSCPAVLHNVLKDLSKTVKDLLQGRLPNLTPANHASRHQTPQQQQDDHHPSHQESLHDARMSAHLGLDAAVADYAVSSRPRYLSRVGRRTEGTELELYPYASSGPGSSGPGSSGPGSEQEAPWADLDRDLGGVDVSVEEVPTMGKREESWLSPQAVFAEMERQHSSVFMTYPVSQIRNQTLATFPAQLPDPDDLPALMSYIRDMKQSMWHLAGTAQLGKVVDDRFRVKHVANLAVVDASTLPQMSRFNPTQTVMALGRYAALLRLRELGIEPPKPSLTPREKRTYAFLHPDRPSS
ncbi:putative GMC oxidoreductase [Gregarina niphandrodes]|uniref:GMC oxidoreductase n=1 Tax=Gregarina niphandrodes TaxID=110365 RepID=A0A023B5Z0_GRENI|nr:putative GMC oxidoreductase [Gregarina niphandrodes]EZG61410.1 putative GMC oxidoreductase [Gregarina niphandrodes]|eukprot:XP_011130770.1 putative GMC oxidoreductase [Gregarina niphandrodes]